MLKPGKYLIYITTTKTRQRVHSSTKSSQANKQLAIDSTSSSTHDLHT